MVGTIERRPALGHSSRGRAFAVLPGANAGIAALGGAVGVPLWMVFGGGSMFLKSVYDELTSRLPKTPTR